MESVRAASLSPFRHPARVCNTSTPVLGHTDGQFGCNGPTPGRLAKCRWSCIWAGRAGGERPLKSRQLRRCAQSKFSAHVCFNPISMLLCLTSLHKLSTWSLTYVIWSCICFFSHNPLDLRVLWTTICWLQLSTVLECHFYSFCSNGALTFVQFDEGNHLQKPGFGHLKSAVTWSGC